MKIAVATDNGNVAAHFGHCPEFTVFEIENGQVKRQEEIPNPGHRSCLLPGFFGDMGVTCIVAGGMGPEAKRAFAARGIITIIGVKGTVEQAVSDFIAGKLVGGPSLCSRRAEGDRIGRRCRSGGCSGHR